MKTATQFADGGYTSIQGQRRSAMAQRRMAGGIRAEANRSHLTGLSLDETRALLDAAEILERLAVIHMSAMAVMLSRVNSRRIGDAETLAAMSDNFAALYTIADRVAFVAAFWPEPLRRGLVGDSTALSRHFDAALASLATRVTAKVAGLAPQPHIAVEWACFIAMRAELASRHAASIVLITESATNAAPHVGAGHTYNLG